jgi:alpha-D-ribose 1-methylphosphonate 5-triphosphate synthase subunit PhnH
MQTPLYSQSEALTHDTFHALMMSLAFPGRPHQIPEHDVFYAIGETLLDIETTFFTPDAALSAVFTRLGSRAVDVHTAAYIFIPTLTDAHLSDLALASTGTMLYPDQSATLIVGATFASGESFSLTGPGIKPDEPQSIQIGGVPAAFWELRARVCHYPLGWDVFLVDGRQVIGLPRTTVMKGE